MKKQQGFTLIEILVAVALVIILSGAGLYGWQSFRLHQQLWQTAWQVRVYLELLRDDANWQNRDHLISASTTEGGWCLLSSVNEQAGCAADNAFALRPLSAGVALADITPSLRFFGLRNTAWPGHIVLRNMAGEWRIIVSNGGRIRMCQHVAATPCI